MVSGWLVLQILINPPLPLHQIPLNSWCCFLSGLLPQPTFVKLFYFREPLVGAQVPKEALMAILNKIRRGNEMVRKINCNYFILENHHLYVKPPHMEFTH